MSNRRCREAAGWLAAREAGSLEDAERIRLQEHLESCGGCRRQAAGMAGVVEMLRESTPRLGGGRADRLWAAVRRGELPRNASVETSSGWLPQWLWAGAGAFALTLLVLAVAGDAILGPPGADVAPAPRDSSPLPAGWAYLNGAAGGVFGELKPGRTLTVPPRGRLAIRAPNELLSADGGTRLSVAGAALRLERGVLRMRNLPGRRCQLSVQVGEVVVTPLGTAFEVRRAAGEPISVAVAHGSVRVSSPATHVIVRSGQRWSSRKLLSLSRRGRRELAQRLGLTVAAVASVGKGASSGHGEQRGIAAALPRVAKPSPKSVARSSRRAPRATRRVIHKPAKLSQPAPQVPAVDLRAIERLLLAGKPRQARQLARTALPSAGVQKAALHTLIAESLVRERWYPQAVAAYLAAYRAGVKSTVGADALYLAGVLELEQLRRPTLAKRRFSRYLSEYKRGRQRQGAHYMLVRSLRAAGDSAGARSAAKRYRSEFPRGRYLLAIGAN